MFIFLDTQYYSSNVSNNTSTSRLWVLVLSILHSSFESKVWTWIKVVEQDGCLRKWGKMRLVLSAKTCSEKEYAFTMIRLIYFYKLQWQFFLMPSISVASFQIRHIPNFFGRHFKGSSCSKLVSPIFAAFFPGDTTTIFCFIAEILSIGEFTKIRYNRFDRKNTWRKSSPKSFSSGGFWVVTEVVSWGTNVFASSMSVSNNVSSSISSSISSFITGWSTVLVSAFVSVRSSNGISFAVSWWYFSFSIDWPGGVSRFISTWSSLRIAWFITSTSSDGISFFVANWSSFPITFPICFLHVSNMEKSPKSLQWSFRIYSWNIILFSCCWLIVLNIHI